MLTLSGKEDACSDFDWSNITSRLNHTKTLHYSMNKSELELEKKVFHLKTLNDVSKEIVFLKDTKDIITRLFTDDNGNLRFHAGNRISFR